MINELYYNMHVLGAELAEPFAYDNRTHYTGSVTCLCYHIMFSIEQAGQ